MSFQQTSLENELCRFSTSLIPSQTQLDEGKRNATRLFELLKQKSKFRIDRVGVFGSIRKQTSINIDFDFDCVVFINDVLPPYENVIQDIEEVLTLAENWSLKVEVSRSPNSIRVMLNDVKFDIVPATNFSQDPREQRERAMAEIRKLKHPAREGYKLSSSMDEVQAAFIQNQSEFAHNFIRLAKFWNRTLLVRGYFSGRSSMIEVMALYVAKEEERKYSTISILRAFRQFLELMTNLNGVKIIFEEYYKVWEIDAYILRQRPLVLDPSNPFNNLAHPFIGNRNMKESFEKFAATTISRLERAVYSLNFNSIFEPQPTMAPIEEVLRSVPPVENWLFETNERRSDKSPSVIIRNERNANMLGVEIIKHYLSKNIKVFNSSLKTKYEMHSEVLNIVTHNILKESISRSMNPCDKRHEDYDVTFEIPGKYFTVKVSTKWN